MIDETPASLGTQLTPRVIIVAASLRSNALGRATTLADVAPTEASIEIWGPATTRRWGVRTEHTIRAVRSRDIASAARELNLAASTGRTVVLWISKGYPFAARLLQSLSRDVLVIADFDDHDVELALSFVKSEWINRLKLNPLRAGSPENLIRSQERVKSRANIFTASSHALARELALRAPLLRVPHARARQEIASSGLRDEIHVGFLGTMRAHKGLERILEALRSDSRLRLVTFVQDEFRPPRDLTDRWTALEANTPLDVAYSLVDVAVIPMSSELAAQLQLPAKAVDAAASGTPIAATGTLVLKEYFGDDLIEVEDWSQLGRILSNLIEEGAMTKARQAMLTVWEEQLDSHSIRMKVSTFIREALAERRATY